MNFLLAAIGTRGVIDPLLAVAIGLQKNGHQVLVCGPANEQERFLSLNLRFIATGTDMKKFVQGKGGKAISSPLRSIMVGAEFFSIQVELQYEALKQHADWADFIIGAGTPMMGSSIAEYTNIPYRHLYHSPTMFPSRHTAPPLTVFWQNQPTAFNVLGWWLSDKINYFTIGRAINRCRKKLKLKPIKSYYDYCSRDVILSINEDLGPLPEDVKVPCIRTGYCHIADNNKLAPEIENFLKAGDAPVYIGFGSMSDPQPEMTMQIMDDVTSRLSARFVISAGWAKLGKTLSEKKNVLVIGPSNFAELMPRMSAAVHHGGPGTVSCVAMAAVPQLVIPHALDQFYWGIRIKELGIGPKGIPRKKLTADNLVTAIKDLLENDLYKRQAHKLAQSIVSEDGVEQALLKIGAKTETAVKNVDHSPAEVD